MCSDDRLPGCVVAIALAMSCVYHCHLSGGMFAQLPGFHKACLGWKGSCLCEPIVHVQAVQPYMPPHPFLTHGALKNWGAAAHHLLNDFLEP